MPENPVLVLEEAPGGLEAARGVADLGIMLNLLKRPSDWEECRSLRIMLH
ncbi:MAG: hypothetical protein Ct9H300mP28_02070 [Pseudomonadota bacterium]|nr:MAG: hypothetical protein Ct9H300mP28_02070 [Pseudomonadota bacterium]